MSRIGLTAVLGLLVAVFGLAPSASAADPAPAELTFATSAASTTPGGTVNLSMTITNHKTYDVLFVYQTIEPTWLTTQRPDLKYSFTGCTLATARARAPAPTTSARTTGPPSRPGRAAP